MGLQLFMQKKNYLLELWSVPHAGDKVRPLEAAALTLVVADTDFQEKISKQLYPKTYFKSGRYRIYGHK